MKEEDNQPESQEQAEEQNMRLNRFVAHAGVASRRKASELIQAGEVSVNEEVVLEPGFRVKPTDVVKHKGKILRPESEVIYLLLNKPKNVITTVSDEKARKTVMDILPKNLPVRIFPVGRLDRNTTGLLLLTNDGDLALRLTHPKHKMSKVYEATLNKPLAPEHLDEIRKGITLEDGPVNVDAINFIHGRPDNEVALEIHLGRNRIVRRIFEHFGYDVIKLDRTRLGVLTKKDLPRGRFRHLTEREIVRLKHF